MKIYNANGNRFIIGSEEIDVIKLCNEYECDGYLKVKGHSFEVINKDGSRANLCVNGLHCVTRYLYEKEMNSLSYTLIVNNVKYKSDILNIDSFTSKVRVGYPKVFKNFVDVGNQHMVILSDDMSQAEELCKRYDCNINYVKVIDRNHIEVITYERGVGYTLSCGSGNTASSVYCYENGLCDNHIIVKNNGGGCEINIGDMIENTTISYFERNL